MNAMSIGKRLAIAVVTLVAASQTAAWAGPPYFIGEWGFYHHCPPGDYSFLHYWTPGVYRVRMWVHPSNLDQFVPAADVPIESELVKQKCIPRPPMPNAPYVAPEAYYGRRAPSTAGIFDRSLYDVK
jgi:hypothetical protein